MQDHIIDLAAWSDNFVTLEIALNAIPTEIATASPRRQSLCQQDLGDTCTTQPNLFLGDSKLFAWISRKAVINVWPQQLLQNPR
jgi:hypothetical protein